MSKSSWRRCFGRHPCQPSECSARIWKRRVVWRVSNLRRRVTSTPTATLKSMSSCFKTPPACTYEPPVSSLRSESWHGREPCRRTFPAGFHRADPSLALARHTNSPASAFLRSCAPQHASLNLGLLQAYRDAIAKNMHLIKDKVVLDVSPLPIPPHPSHSRLPTPPPRPLAPETVQARRTSREQRPPPCVQCYSLLWGAPLPSPDTSSEEGWTTLPDDCTVEYRSYTPQRLWYASSPDQRFPGGR